MPRRRAGVDRGAADSAGRSGTPAATGAGPRQLPVRSLAPRVRRFIIPGPPPAAVRPRGALPSFPDPQRAMAAKKATKKPNPALMKPVQPDDVLAVIVGNKPMPRSEITKKLWDYIKKHGLQDQKVKTNINADDALKAVCGGKSKGTMFEMTTLGSAHIKG